MVQVAGRGLSENGQDAIVHCRVFDRRGRSASELTTQAYEWIGPVHGAVAQH